MLARNTVVLFLFPYFPGPLQGLHITFIVRIHVLCVSFFLSLKVHISHVLSPDYNSLPSTPPTPPQLPSCLDPLPLCLPPENKQASKG